MATLFEDVTVYSFNKSALSFEVHDNLTDIALEVHDEAENLLVRQKTAPKSSSNSTSTTTITQTPSDKPLFSVRIFKTTPCAEFSDDGFVVEGDNSQSFYLKFGRKHVYDHQQANYKEKDVIRFGRLVNHFKDGKTDSIFNLRTDDSSAAQYFQFYGYLSQQQNMLQDYVRTSTYQRAILSNLDDFKDKVVLDVGAGSGILSFFAAQAGAKKVYAVEASSMAKHARALVQANSLHERIQVVSGKIEEITLPEQVDIIISEPMGYMLFNERMLETYMHAKKFLKPNGNMYPRQGDLHVAPFSDAQLYTEQVTKANFWLQNNFHGVDLSVLREEAIKEFFHQPIVDTFDIRVCLSKSEKYVVDFLKDHENDLHVLDIPLKFEIHQTDEIHGLAFWFDVAFIGSQQTVWLSTAPTQPLTHWYQIRCLVDRPLFVQKGQTVVGRCLMVANRRQSYNVTIEIQVEGIPNAPVSKNTLDLKNPYFRFTGQPVQPPPGCNETSPSEDYWQTFDLHQPTATNGQAPTNGLNNNSMPISAQFAPGSMQSIVLQNGEAIPIADPLVGTNTNIAYMPYSTTGIVNACGGIPQPDNSIPVQYQNGAMNGTPFSADSLNNVNFQL